MMKIDEHHAEGWSNTDQGARMAAKIIRILVILGNSLMSMEKKSGHSIHDFA